MRLIVFDCDGTLIDGQHVIVAAMTAAFAENGRAAPPRAKVLRHVGLSLLEIMAVLSDADDAALHAALAASYRTAFGALRRDHAQPEPMFPGAREAVETLRGREGVLLGIATGKSRRGVDMFLAREGLESAFATLQTADDAPSKPHPAMLLQAMAETGAAPRETVMIGDTSYDMIMARDAGALPLGVAWGYHTPEELAEAGAVAVARDYPHLLALLASGNGEAAA